MPVAQVNTARRWDMATARFLLVVAGVTGYCTFQWLLENLHGSGFVARASATIIAVGIASAIWWFWHVLYALAPTLRAARARLGVLAVALIGTILIVAGSANPNAAAISGAAAQNTAMDFQIGEFERATAERDEAAHQLSGVLTDLGAIITKLDLDAKAEFERGAISGVAKQGAVYDLLTRLGLQLSELRTAIQKQQDESKIVLAAARNDLAAMRGTSGKGLSTAERMRQVGAAADVLRSKLNGLDTRPLAASMTRLIEGLPQEVGSLALKLSDDPRVAKRQREALERLRGEIAGTTERLAALGAALAAATPSELPAFRPTTGSEAVRVQWRSYLSTWAIALALDCFPFFGFLWLLITNAAKSRAELIREDIAALTVRDLVLSGAANDLLRAKVLDASALRALVDDQLGKSHP